MKAAGNAHIRRNEAGVRIWFLVDCANLFFAYPLHDCGWMLLLLKGSSLSNPCSAMAWAYLTMEKEKETKKSHQGNARSN